MLVRDVVVRVALVGVSALLLAGCSSAPSATPGLSGPSTEASSTLAAETSGQGTVDQAVDHFTVARNALVALKGGDGDSGLTLLDRGVSEFGRLADATRAGIEDVPSQLTSRVADAASTLASDISELASCVRSLESPDTEFEQCESAAPGTPDDLIALEDAMVALIPFGSRPLDEVVDRIDGPPLVGLSSTPTPSSPSNPGSSGTTGTTVDGTGYRYTVPPGWGTSSQNPLASYADTFAADLADDDTFTDNINVVVTPAVSMSLDAAEKVYADALAATGFADVTISERRVVAGDEVPHLTLAESFNDVKATAEQFYLTHDGKSFVVTFSFSDDVSAADRELVTSEVLDSWTWTG